MWRGQNVRNSCMQTFSIYARTWCFAFVATTAAFSVENTVAEPLQRMVVLTDIEADPDDTQSLVRLLLYANSIDIESIVATTSVHQKARVAPESIRRVIDAYGKVHANLLLHEPGFPEAQTLQD